MTETPEATIFELRHIEAELADAYESALFAAETLEVPLWDDLGAKISAALADVRAGLVASEVASGQSRPRPSDGLER
jgi:hypothetical protein